MKFAQHASSDTQDDEITKLATGASISLVGKLSGAGLHALGQIVMARTLGPELFGLYAFGWASLRLAGALLPLGLDRGIIHFASKYSRTDHARLKGLFIRSVGLAMFSGALAGVALYCAAPWLENFFQEPGLASVFRWFASAFTLFAGLKVVVAATQVSHQMQYAVYTEDIARPALNLLLFLLFYSLGWKVSGALGATVISIAFALLAALYFLNKLFPELPRMQAKTVVPLKALIVFSLPIAFAGLSTALNSILNRMFIGYFRPAADVGIYQAIAQTSVLFSIILAAVNAIFSPLIADLYESRELVRLDELFKISTKWALYLSLPVFLTIFFAPHELLAVLFGNSYTAGAVPLVILAAGQILNVATGGVGYVLIMTGNQKSWLAVSVVTVLTNLCLNWLLIPPFGITGAAMATALSTTMLFILALIATKKTLGLWPYDRRYVKGIIAAAVTTATMLAIHSIHLKLELSALTMLSLTVFATLTAFGGTLYLAGWDAEDRELFALVSARLYRVRNR